MIPTTTSAGAQVACASPGGALNNSMRSSTRLAVGLVMAIAVMYPFVASGFQTLQATYVIIYAIALLGLNMLLGYSGQLSLGHGAFFGLGAFINIILIKHAGFPYWTTMIPVAIVCFITGFLFGLPALRLEGAYLALATFVLALALPSLLKHPALTKWTGGFMGLTLPPTPVPPGLPLSSDQWLYLFCLAHALVLFLVGWNLMRGRTGRAIVALRDYPAAAVAMGVNAAWYKSSIFGIGAMYAGLAGALSALVTQFASPDSFDLFLSIGFVVGVVVGGIATVPGALFGALFIHFVPDLASEISKSAAWAVYGATLVLCMYFFPKGVVGFFATIENSARRYFETRHAEVET
jgi:branched-chain amino acid transport system permease protein